MTSKVKNSQNKSTRVIPIRVSVEQLTALQSLPEGVSVSALARTLFAVYLEGALPSSFAERLYNEVAETGIRVRNKQRLFTEARKAGKELKADDRRKQQQPESREGLRERILLSFRERSSSSSAGDSL